MPMQMNRMNKAIIVMISRERACMKIDRSPLFLSAAGMPRQH